MSQGPLRPSIAEGIESIRRRWPDLPDESDERPIFILSAGWRSGSTLLQRALTHECLVWGEPYGHSGLIEAMAEPLRCFHEIWPEPQFFYAGEGPGVLIRRFVANLYPPVQDLLLGHRRFFEQVFAEPARRAGAPRWGLKEVRLSADHAAYLRWLFPRAKFLFLIRNPYDAFRSYAARRDLGWRWYRRWPDEPVTTEVFARNWRVLVESFLEGHRKVDGILVKYEDLVRGEFAPVEQYLGFGLCREALEINPGDGGPPPREITNAWDRDALRREIGSLASSLGYELRVREPKGAEGPSASGT